VETGHHARLLRAIGKEEEFCAEIAERIARCRELEYLLPAVYQSALEQRLLRRAHGG
jgi:hypothetical protein